ncbi:PEGA domain-containing protein [Candidatus Woesearchaeota archaeon]|nr:PEGA domain-containing protein [Candidatus Woesearchaeota archaeon]
MKNRGKNEVERNLFFGFIFILLLAIFVNNGFYTGFQVFQNNNELRLPSCQQSTEAVTQSFIQDLPEIYEKCQQNKITCGVISSNEGLITLLNDFVNQQDTFQVSLTPTSIAFSDLGELNGFTISSGGSGLGVVSGSAVRELKEKNLDKPNLITGLQIGTGVFRIDARCADIGDNRCVADIYIDNVRGGQTSTSGQVDISVSAGTHSVKLIKRGYVDSIANQNVVSGGRATVTRLLGNPSVATLNLQTIPVGASVSGATAGCCTPFSVSLSGNQQYTVYFTIRGYSNQQVTQYAYGGETTTFTANFGSPLSSTISITSNPLGASVTVDGVSRGISPLTVSDLSGNTYHTVVLSKSGYNSQTITQYAYGGETTPISATLQQTAPGVLKITSNPDANIFINQETTPRGKTDSNGIISITLPIGNYNIKISKAGYVSFSQSAIINSGQTTNLQTTLVTNLEISGNPLDAQVFINEETSPRTRPFMLIPGNYKITVKKEDLIKIFSSVSISEIQQTNLQYNLFEGKGKLDFSSQPSGVTIILDGQNIGVTPKSIYVTSGQDHSYTLPFGDCQKVISTVNIAEGGTKTISKIFIEQNAVDVWSDKNNFNELPNSFKISCDNFKDPIKKIAELFFKDLPSGTKLAYSIEGNAESGYKLSVVKIKTISEVSCLPFFGMETWLQEHPGEELPCKIKEGIKGDLDSDGKVGGRDLLIFEKYLRGDDFSQLLDLNNDGKVDNQDKQNLIGLKTEVETQCSTDTNVYSCPIIGKVISCPAFISGGQDSRTSIGGKGKLRITKFFIDPPISDSSEGQLPSDTRSISNVRDKTKIKFSLQGELIQIPNLYLYYADKKFSVGLNKIRQDYAEGEFTIDFSGIRDYTGCSVCSDKDNDGFSPEGGYCGPLDCNDDPSNDESFCSAVVCCQNSETNEYLWGIKTGNSCNNDLNLWALFGDDKCVDRKVSRVGICKSTLYAACSFCNYPVLGGDDRPRICGTNNKCTGVWNGLSDGTACEEDEQCVIHLEESSGINECRFSPGGAKETIIPNVFPLKTNKDARCELNFITGSGVESKLDVAFNCLPEKEDKVIDSRYGELDFNKFISKKYIDKEGNEQDNPCRKTVLKKETGWKTNCVKKDKCKDGVDNDGKEDLNNIFKIFSPFEDSTLRTGFEIIKKYSESETCTETEHLGKTLLVTLADGDDPECYNKGWDADDDRFLGSHKGYCDMIKHLGKTEGGFAAIKERDKIPQLCVNYDYCLENKECFPFAESKLFSDCDNYEGDDDEQDFNNNGIPDYHAIVLGSSPPQSLPVKERIKLLDPEKYVKALSLTGATREDYIKISAKYVHPFAPLSPYPEQEALSCGTADLLDINCNKNFKEGYSVDYENGVTPWDDDMTTGAELYGGDVSFFSSKNRDLFCMPPEHPEWQTAKYLLVGGTLVAPMAVGFISGFFPVIAPLVGKVGVALTAITLPAVLYHFNEVAPECVKAFEEFRLDKDAEWCPKIHLIEPELRPECEKYFQVSQKCADMGATALFAVAGAQSLRKIAGESFIQSPYGQKIITTYLKRIAVEIPEKQIEVPIEGQIYTATPYRVKVNWLAKLLGVPVEGAVETLVPIPISKGQFVMFRISEGEGGLVLLKPVEIPVENLVGLVASTAKAGASAQDTAMAVGSSTLGGSFIRNALNSQPKPLEQLLVDEGVPENFALEIKSCINNKDLVGLEKGTCKLLRPERLALPAPKIDIVSLKDMPIDSIEKTIVIIGPISAYSKAYRVIFKNGVKAFFRSGNSGKIEEIVYKLSEELELGAVPETDSYKITPQQIEGASIKPSELEEISGLGNVEGSLQLAVEGGDPFQITKTAANKIKVLRYLIGDDDFGIGLTQSGKLLLHNLGIAPEGKVLGYDFEHAKFLEPVRVREVTDATKKTLEDIIKGIPAPTPEEIPVADENFYRLMDFDPTEFVIEQVIPRFPNMPSEVFEFVEDYLLTTQANVGKTIAKSCNPPLHLKVKETGLPFGFNKDMFTQLSNGVFDVLDRLPFTYDPKKVMVVGSSVIGVSSKTGERFVFGSDKDIDINIVMDEQNYNSIAKKIEDAFKISTYSSAEKDLKKFQKDYPTGLINARYLKVIDPIHKLEGEMIDLGKSLGVKKIQVGVVREEGPFDKSGNIPLTR